jgi:parallel beta-helix repeat protein
LPDSGGIADARGIKGKQTLPFTILIDKPVKLLLGVATYTCAATTSCFNLSVAGASIEGKSAAESVIFVPGIAADGINPTSYTSIRNITLRGPNSKALGFSGIDTGGTTGIEIAQNIIENWGNHGINSGGRSTRHSIVDNVVRNNFDDGILIAEHSSHITVQRNRIHNNGSNGIDVGGGSFNLIVSNTVEHNGGNHFKTGVDCWGILIAAIGGELNSDANYNVTHGNTVRHSRCQGIIVKSISGQQASHNTITGNTVEGSSGANGDGICLDGSSPGLLHANTVVGNVVRKNRRHGILVDGSVGKAAENLIAGNTIQGNTVKGLWIEGGEAIDNIALGNTAIENQTNMDFGASVRTMRFLNKDKLPENTFVAGVFSGAGGSPSLFYGKRTAGWVITENIPPSACFRIDPSTSKFSAEGGLRRGAKASSLPDLNAACTNHESAFFPAFNGGQNLAAQTCYEQVILTSRAPRANRISLTIPPTMTVGLVYIVASDAKSSTISVCNTTRNDMQNPGLQVF